MSFTLLSSPLQGFTDFRFRNAQNKIFGGIDTFYSPYIRLNGKLVVKASYERDLLPENNNSLFLVMNGKVSLPSVFILFPKFIGVP